MATGGLNFVSINPGGPHNHGPFWSDAYGWTVINWPESTTAPHKCPACDGWGKRQVEPSGQCTADTGEVACRACSGVGLVWR